MVAPDLAGRGLGRQGARLCRGPGSSDVTTLWINTGRASAPLQDLSEGGLPGRALGVLGPPATVDLTNPPLTPPAPACPPNIEESRGHRESSAATRSFRRVCRPHDRGRSDSRRSAGRAQAHQPLGDNRRDGLRRHDPHGHEHLRRRCLRRRNHAAEQHPDERPGSVPQHRGARIWSSPGINASGMCRWTIRAIVVRAGTRGPATRHTRSRSSRNAASASTGQGDRSSCCHEDPEDRDQREPGRRNRPRQENDGGDRQQPAENRPPSPGPCRRRLHPAHCRHDRDREHHAQHDERPRQTADDRRDDQGGEAQLRDRSGRRGESVRSAREAAHGIRAGGDDQTRAIAHATGKPGDDRHTPHDKRRFPPGPPALAPLTPCVPASSGPALQGSEPPHCRRGRQTTSTPMRRPAAPEEGHSPCSVSMHDRPGLPRDRPPAFRAGDTVKVHVKVVEGNRPDPGVPGRRHPASRRIGETFTVRKGLLRCWRSGPFPLHTPIIDKIEVVTRG